MHEEAGTRQSAAARIMLDVVLLTHACLGEKHLHLGRLQALDGARATVDSDGLARDSP
jgi:hypothetical protein